MTDSPQAHILTDEQVAELATLGPLGEDAAYSLGLWREASEFPEIEFHGGISVPSQAAIIHDRNTAELRAALTYWQIKFDIFNFEEYGEDAEAANMEKLQKK